ncbi:MAG TPA: ABC transporter ATP-binding protein [Desulfovibrio sp.]|nr:ABC transporter ATP-binding protein [Desulfovibrio sp.]MDY0305330.1 ABC transporter ATP-binding protein [Desulfovibrionaceae bacterium]HMM37598.1 ABC transporter ATP-binding protein [Desulfovibrio sp.]
MLDIRNINVFYGDVQVIWDVSFNVREGEIVALIGANGAGKSTILRTISGLLRPASGEILFDTAPIHTMEPYRLIDLGLAHCPEARRLFVEMSVEENLDMGALRGEAKKNRAATKEMVYGLFPRLKERRRQQSGTLSGGEQQMLAIGRALMSHPKLVMFDEPSLGLAPILVRDIFEIIGKIRAEGRTVLIVEQNVRQTLAIADRAYVLETGKLVMQGEGRAMLNDPHVKAAYLGV